MKKYEIQGVIGMGAYGVVLKAVNKQSRENVAIKKFKESDSNPIIRKIALREVKALRHVNHPNLVKFKEAFRREDKLNIVFEYLPKTVLEDIEQNPQGLSPSLIQSYMF
jgi:cyclin-dependent kinase-like